MSAEDPQVPSRESQINLSYEELGVELSALQNEIEILEDRLKVALRPSPLVEGQPDKTPVKAAPKAPLAESLDVVVRQICYLRSRVQQIADRIEL